MKPKHILIGAGVVFWATAHMIFAPSKRDICAQFRSDQINLEQAINKLNLDKDTSRSRVHMFCEFYKN